MAPPTEGHVIQYVCPPYTPRPVDPACEAEREAARPGIDDCGRRFQYRPGGYVRCARRSGHDGIHIAGSTGEIWARWTDDE